MKLPNKNFLVLAMFAALGACGGEERVETAPAPQQYGPSGDYPVVIGDPFTVDGVVYTPSDTLNYDEVGYAALDTEGGPGVSAAHRTLPMPSYAEVTSLASGRTILVRIERRGPMTGNRLIALSPGAATQLGIGEGTPVRVRRVNPPEQERAMLRRGQNAPERMETPDSLVEVLKRKLPANPDMQIAADAAALSDEIAAKEGADGPDASAQETIPTPVATPTSQPAIEGGYVVQAGAYSTRERAKRVADAIEGFVSPSGSLFKVRTGPFASKEEARSSLAKVKAAGYSDARIFRSD